MPLNKVRAVLACSLFLTIARPAMPQNSNSSETSDLHGEIQTNEPFAFGLTIQLYDLGRHATVETANIRSDGEFEFHHTPNGLYLLSVRNALGDTVYESSVTVGGIMPPLVVHLPKEEIKQPGAGLVSVKQLQHPPSRKAFDAFREAQRFADAGDAVKCENYLRKAVELSPDFGDAWLNLGAEHMKAGLYSQAIDETRHAMEFAGPSAKAYGNLAYALAHLGRSEEARKSAEEALRLQPEDPRANYLFGILLYQAHVDDAEAVRHLKIAAASLSSARQILAEIGAK